MLILDYSPTLRGFAVARVNVGRRSDVYSPAQTDVIGASYVPLCVGS